MRMHFRYLTWIARLLWTFRSDPSARLRAMRGLWLDYYGDELRRIGGN